MLGSLPDMNLLPDYIKSTVAGFNAWSLLHHMGLVFVLVVGYMLWQNHKSPLDSPVTLPDQNKVDTTPEPKVFIMGGAVIALTVLLYILFW